MEINLHCNFTMKDRSGKKIGLARRAYRSTWLFSDHIYLLDQLGPQETAMANCLLVLLVLLFLS